MCKATIQKAVPTLAVALMLAWCPNPPQAEAQIVRDGLDFRLDFDDQATNWSKRHCDNQEDCDIEIKIRDGVRFVIVNGDTVETSKLFDDGRVWGSLDRYRPMLEGFRSHFVVDDPGEHGFAFFGGDKTLGLFDFPGPRFSDHLDLVLSSDETLTKMERRARELAREARLAEGERRAELDLELREKLGEIFDYKHDQHRRSVEATEERLAEMRERLRERESVRDDIIEQRQKDLLGKEDYLDW